MSDHVLQIGDVFWNGGEKWRVDSVTAGAARAKPVTAKPVTIHDKLKGTTRTFVPSGRAIYVSPVIGREAMAA